jgi:hypothetical protein
MLDFAYVTASREPDPNDVRDKLQHLMSMECFYVHARNLIEFYHGVKAQTESRTAVADEFTKAKISYPEFGNDESDINDQVAHLNLARGTHAHEPMDGTTLNRIYEQLGRCLDSFQSNLSEDAAKVWQPRVRRFYAPESNTFNSACTASYESLSHPGGPVLSTAIDNVYFSYNANATEIHLSLGDPILRANNG